MAGYCEGLRSPRRSVADKCSAPPESSSRWRGGTPIESVTEREREMGKIGTRKRRVADSRRHGVVQVGSACRSIANN